MADIVLDAQVRSTKGKKVSQLRNQGLVPGALYGPHIEPTKLQFKYRELEQTLLQAGGTHLVDINVEGEAVPALAREVQRDIIKGNILHVDFFAVDMSAKIRADIPLVFTGESPLVAARKAIMITGPNSLTVETLPGNLMDHIYIDVSVLTEMGDSIAVRDLDVGDVTIINDPEEMLAKIVQPSAVRAEEEAEEAEVAEVAVVGEAEEEE